MAGKINRFLAGRPVTEGDANRQLGAKLMNRTGESHLVPHSSSFGTVVSQRLVQVGPPHVSAGSLWACQIRLRLLHDSSRPGVHRVPPFGLLCWDRWSRHSTGSEVRRLAESALHFATPLMGVLIRSNPSGSVRGCLNIAILQRIDPLGNCFLLRRVSGRPGPRRPLHNPCRLPPRCCWWLRRRSPLYRCFPAVAAERSAAFRQWLGFDSISGCFLIRSHLRLAGHFWPRISSLLDIVGIEAMKPFVNFGKFAGERAKGFDGFISLLRPVHGEVVVKVDQTVIEIFPFLNAGLAQRRGLRRFWIQAQSQLRNLLRRHQVGIARDLFNQCVLVQGYFALAFTVKIACFRVDSCGQRIHFRAFGHQGVCHIQRIPGRLQLLIVRLARL